MPNFVFNAAANTSALFISYASFLRYDQRSRCVARFNSYDAHCAAGQDNHRHHASGRRRSLAATSTAQAICPVYTLTRQMSCRTVLPPSGVLMPATNRLSVTASMIGVPAPCAPQPETLRRACTDSPRIVTATASDKCKSADGDSRVLRTSNAIHRPNIATGQLRGDHGWRQPPVIQHLARAGDHGSDMV